MKIIAAFFAAALLAAGLPAVAVAKGGIFITNISCHCIKVKAYADGSAKNGEPVWIDAGKKGRSKIKGIHYVGGYRIEMYGGPICEAVKSSPPKVVKHRDFKMGHDDTIRFMAAETSFDRINLRFSIPGPRQDCAAELRKELSDFQLINMSLEEEKILRERIKSAGGLF